MGCDREDLGYDRHIHVQVATWLTSQLNTDWVTCFTGEIGVSNHSNGIPHSCTEVSEGVLHCSWVFNVDWVHVCTGVGGIDQLVPSDIGSWDPGDPDLIVANSLCCNVNRTSRRSCRERSQRVVEILTAKWLYLVVNKTFWSFDQTTMSCSLPTCNTEVCRESSSIIGDCAGVLSLLTSPHSQQIVVRGGGCISQHLVHGVFWTPAV